MHIHSVNTMTKVNLKENDKGFTFVELCIVVVTMAIMAAWGIPQLSSAMRSMKIASDARSIATTMTYAKLNAASMTTRCRVLIDLDRNEWQLQRRNPSSGAWELQQAVNQLRVGGSGIAFKRTSSTAPPLFHGDGAPSFPTDSSTTFTFSSRGTLIEPSSGMGIIYISNNNEDYAVSVSVSGKAQIWRYRSSQWVEQ